MGVGAGGCVAGVRCRSVVPPAIGVRAWCRGGMLGRGLPVYRSRGFPGTRCRRL